MEITELAQYRKKLLAVDLKWLQRQPHDMERDHIETTLKETARQEDENERLRTRCEELEKELSEVPRMVARANILATEVAALRTENERLTTALATATAALAEIKEKEGRVCEDYGFCQHVACSSSYGAWAIADKALASLEGK